jgi:hypothetical protein
MVADVEDVAVGVVGEEGSGGVVGDWGASTHGMLGKRVRMGKTEGQLTCQKEHASRRVQPRKRWQRERGRERWRRTAW